MELRKLFDIKIKDIKQLESNWISFKNDLTLEHTYYNEITKEELLHNLKLIRVLLAVECAASKDTKVVSLLRQYNREIRELQDKFKD